MAKKIFILNVSSEQDLIYVYRGCRITKQQSDVIFKESNGKVKFVTQELVNMRVLNPDKPRSISVSAILDVEVNEEDEEEIKELILGL
jgi:hypothetical protein